MQLQKEMGQHNEKEEIESFKNIADCAKQLSQTIDDFRNFFSSDKTTDDYNLKDLYIKSLSLIEAQFKNRNIKIIENIQDVTMNILGNELIQVIVNILNNARDALDSKRQDKVIHVNIYKDDEYAYIVIKDNAGGIKAQNVDEVFEPYFTTKGDKNGTGIGLYMSKEIVEKHMEGELLVKNVSFNCNEHSCHGAEFTIKIPF
jgi:signal transduction histidine kinase